MKFPIKLTKLKEQEKDVFLNNFANENGEFEFEGVWFRNQRRENAKQSGWTGEGNERRRYIQFYDTYKILQQNNENYLSITKSYIYISSTYPKQETEKYYNKIVSALKEEEFLDEEDNDGFIYEVKKQKSKRKSDIEM